MQFWFQTACLSGSRNGTGHMCNRYSKNARDHLCHVNIETSTQAPWGGNRSIIIIFLLENFSYTYWISVEPITKNSKTSLPSTCLISSTKLFLKWRARLIIGLWALLSPKYHIWHPTMLHPTALNAIPTSSIDSTTSGQLILEPLFKWNSCFSRADEI